MNKTARRSVLWAGITGIAALLVGNKAQAAPPKPGLCNVRCCGTCGHLDNNSSFHYQGNEALTVSIFGWCDLVSAPPTPKSIGHTGSMLCFSSDSFNPNANRHFLMTCPKWTKRKKDANGKS
jgi:hypothetical protein